MRHDWSCANQEKIKRTLRSFGAIARSSRDGNSMHTLTLHSSREKRMRISLYTGLILALAAGHATAGSFTDVGVPGASLTSLSRNGRIAAGVTLGGSVFRWNKDSGAVTLAGFDSSNGMNSWGQPVAGSFMPDGNPANAVAALWYTNSELLDGPQIIGGYPGTGGGTGQGISTAYGVSDNGIAVGLAYDETNNPIAFQWTDAGGMTRLPVNRPTTYSRANGISHDGSVIYGWNDQLDGYRSGVIWQNGVALDLTDDQGNPIGEALAASSDGRVVVGANYGFDNQAWRWTAETGVQPIGVLAAAPGAVKAARGGNLQPSTPVQSERASALVGSPDGFFPPQAYAFGVSDDGNVVVGRSGAFPVQNAVIWTPATGMQYLSDYVTAHGVTIPAGWSLISANAVSADGKVIGGWGSDGNDVASFVIDLHERQPVAALFDAHGTVAYNDLTVGPFAGVAEGTPVSMSFQARTSGGFDISPGQYTAYPITLPSFKLRAGTASDTLIAVTDGPLVGITNDYPRSDGIHMFTTPLATAGTALEFELFNPGGDMFDSDDLEHINRTFGPEFFEKTSWVVWQGDNMMWIELDSVSIKDAKVRISATR
jgi:uncharacterized membrane protein